MDIWHTCNGIRFVWNAKKAADNVKDHGVTFEMACEVFFDPFIRVVNASREGEERDKAIGYTEGSSLLLCVVHIVWEDDAFRIISAWGASTDERKIYENL
ncbi:MAG: BrnT family toxin [Sulfuricella sp.]